MKRSYLLYALITIIGCIYILRLFQLQIINRTESNVFKQDATKKIVYEYPSRGYIYDRNGKLLVANQLSYDVMIVPKDVQAFDTIAFCKLLKIDKEYLLKKHRRATNYARWLPSTFLKQLAKEDYAYLQEKLQLFPGFYVQKRIIRNYPYPSAANVLGYIGEVNQKEIEKSEHYYHRGELKGKSGIESQYEDLLRGKRGKKHYRKNILSKVVGSYKNGIYDTASVSGKDLTLTIDIDLQLYGEKLMKGKRGGIVAIEPSTGEVLALITAPSYDPNMMVGRKRSENSVKLMNDSINQPMFDRGLKAMYSPGSPFKMINGLIGLQEGVITETSHFYCHHGISYGKNNRYFMGCHCGIWGGRKVRLRPAISKSCNSYFANTYFSIINKYETSARGLDVWANHVNSFGLGKFLGYDLPEGRKGLIPKSQFYNDYYNSRWGAQTTISNAIGQGEVITSPIQLANATAAIANKGHFFTPHFLKKINDSTINNPEFTIAKNTTIDKKYFTPIIEAMRDVFISGTGSSQNILDIEICGKTGTVENQTRIGGKVIKLEDHSILVAFAPKDNPKIVLAVFVENGGYGSTIAAPITSLMIERYLKKETRRPAVEKRIMAIDLHKEYNKTLKNESR